MLTNTKFYGENPKFGIGIVEDIRDPLKAGRVRVRIFGIHSPFTDELPTTDLPWSQVIMPVTSASLSGEGDTPQLLVGSQVFGIFLDGDSYQQFLVLGSMIGFEGRTTIQTSTNDSNFDLTRNPESSATQAINLVGGSNAEKAFHFFVQYGGYTEDQAGGIVGALASVSTEELNTERTGGIANWSGARLKNLKAFGAQSGISYKDLVVQVSFILNELQTEFVSVSKRLVNTSSAAESAKLIAKSYIGKSSSSAERLGVQAKAAYGSTIGNDTGKFKTATVDRNRNSIGEIVETAEELLNLFKGAKKKRKITELIIHDTDTYEDEQVSVFDIQKTHKNFGGVQFHFLIQRNGNLQIGRDIALPEQTINNVDVAKNATTVSENGKRFIKNEEGLRLTAYQDPPGSERYAIGYGFNDGTIRKNQTITLEEAERLFDISIADVEKSLNAALNNTPINQNQFDAYASLIYNIGGGAFQKTISLSRFKAGKIQEAADAILNLDNITVTEDGKTFKRKFAPLTKRRNRERVLFLTPIGNENKQTITRSNNTISLALAGGKIGTAVQRGSNVGATYTPKQYETFNLFLANYISIWPDSNILGHSDINPLNADPYFDVPSYVRDKFNHINKKEADLNPVIPERQIKITSPSVSTDIIQTPMTTIKAPLAEPPQT